MSLRAGTIIDDTWVIEESLGVGGMGSVYRAHNRHAPRIKAAIKMLSRELLVHPEATARFVREAEILFGLDHPHIVKVRNVRLDHVPPYIEMEFIEGVSLYGMMRKPPFPFDRALLFAEQLSGAVRYLHRHQVFHRDIKPANLLVKKGTVLKLVDFGLAVDLEESERITQAGAHFGTVAYAPPEWVRPRELDPRLWDIYAIGVILYEMLTGMTPFVADSGASPRQAAIQVMTIKQQLEHLDPGAAYPEGLRALVRELTAREPEDRLQDARDVIARLQKIQAELSFNANTVLASGLSGDELRQAVHERLMEVNRPRTQHDDVAEPVEPQLVQVAVPAPKAEEATAPPIASTMRALPHWMQLAGVGVLGFFLTASVGLFTAGAIIGYRQWTAPRARAVTLLVTGVPRDAELRLLIDEQEAVQVDGLEHRFPPLEPGPHDVTWSAGPGCGEAPCPGVECSDTCRQGGTLVIVENGSEVQQVPVELALPVVRDVDLPLADVPEGTKVWRAGQAVAVVDGVARLRGLEPGDHEVEMVAGTCASDARGCADASDCPPGCSSRVWTMHVPAEGGVDLPVVSLPAPAPVPVAPRRPRGTGGGPVSRSAFGAWLASHPEWARGRALAEGRVDDAYLKGVSLQGSGPMVSVTWTAAQAFCANHGGLASVDQAPLTWAEAEGGLFQEWRSDGATRMWLRYDGASSSKVKERDANAFTGFRCRR